MPLRIVRHAGSVTTTAPTGTYRSAVRIAEFDALIGGSLISILGDSAAFLAVTVLVYQRTGSSLLSALTFAIAFVPYLFGGTMLAALVDRLPPKTLLVGFDLIGAALVAAIAVPGVPVPAMFVVLFCLGVLAPVRSGASGALLAEILPGDTFLAGRSLQRICIQSGQIAGTALGGALIAGFGPRGALVADTVTFLISALLTVTVLRSRPAPSSSNRQSLLGDSWSGLHAVWSHRAVRRLLLLGWIVPFVAVAPEGLAAPAVVESGHATALVGLWLAAIPVGTVAGDLLLVWAVPPWHRTRLTWPLAVVLPSLLLGFAIGLPLWAELILLTSTGAASAYGLGLDLTLRDTTPEPLLGRMYTLYSTGLMVTQGLGFAVAGGIGQGLPAHTAIALEAAVGLVAVGVLSRSRS